MEVKVKDTSGSILTVDEIKNYIKLDSSIDTDDALIAQFLSSAINLSEKFLNLSLLTHTIECRFDADDLENRRIELPYGPCISISSFKSVNPHGEETDMTLNENYTSKGSLYPELCINTIYGTGYSGDYSYVVEYTTGFGDDATEDLPAVVKTALLKQVEIWYDNRDNHAAVLSDSVRELLSPISRNQWL